MGICNDNKLYGTLTTDNEQNCEYEMKYICFDVLQVCLPLPHCVVHFDCICVCICI